ncbi:MAG: methyl-accepting chemotaxis protein [Bacillota bacterium]
MKSTQTVQIPLFRRLKTKIMIPISLVLVLVVGSMGMILYTISYNIIVQNTADNAYSIALSLSGVIDAEGLKSIDTLEDEQTEAYAAIRNELSQAREVTGSKYIYTMKKAEDGQFIYLVDGSAEEDFSHVGDVEETLVGFETVWGGQPYKGSAIEVQEGWGALVSAYSPILDSNGDVVGFVGVDYDASDEYAGLQHFQTLAIVISAAGILVSVLLGWLLANYITKPIKDAAHCANALAAGELDTPIRIRSRDEIGQLAGILDKEVRGAFKNIGHMNAISEKQARYQREEARKVLANIGRLAQGELYCDITVGTADQDTQELYEIYAQIAESLTCAVGEMKGYINEIAHVLGRLSEGDLTEAIVSEYHGDFVMLKDSINRIISIMSSVLSEIGTAADQVAIGTGQMSDGSQEIAQGATEQASAIEELTASITQIAAQTRQNALSANNANELAGRATTEASRGNESMRAMQGAMEEISEASRSISKIIKVIDDIAFQTNLLALNAAVEAARAGEHGRGFAVVAEEVRNLAAHSASAAMETAELIEGSIAKTEAGTKIADDTSAALDSIVGSVGKAAQLVSEIAKASNEQAGAIAQINNGIEQLATVVQTNSATSEEAAATSEELSRQAEMLKNLVSQFRLNRQKDRASVK